MKPVRNFVAERRVVQHCPELLSSTRQTFDLAAASTEFAAELALALPVRLEALLLGPRIVVTDWPAETLTVTTMLTMQTTPATHYAIAIGPRLPVFVASFDNELALTLTDRMFGGSGDAPSDAPKVLPQSAALAVERLVRAVADALMPLCGGEQACPKITSHTAFRRLGVFWRGDRALQWSFTVEQEGHDPWNLRLSVPEAMIRILLEERAAGARSGDAAAPSEPLAGAMAHIPLPLTAVLAELRVPLARLATLRPGATIPFAPRREVPLVIGGQTIATATVGALDERVALRLTRLS